MHRNISLDILKLIMAFMVIGIHTNFLADISALGRYLTVSGLFRIAVPIFLVINGFFFYSVLMKGEAKQWFAKIVMLYIFWMVFYVFYWFPQSGDVVAFLKKISFSIGFGYYHLWYIVGLIFAALMLRIVYKLSSFLLSVLVMVLFLIGCFIQYSGNYHVFQGTILDKVFNFFPSHRNFLFTSFPFFCIGYLLRKHAMHTRFSVQFLLIVALISVALLVGESCFNYYQESNDGSFDNFLSLLLAAPAVFLLFMNLHVNGESKSIALYSSAIYFIHLFVFFMVAEIIGIEEGTLVTLLTIVASIVAAYFVIQLNKKITFIL